MLSPSSPDAIFTRRVLIVAGVAALALTLWYLARLVLLVFGAVMLAVLLSALARLLERYLRLPYRLSVALAAVLIAGLLAGTLLPFGVELRGQFDELVARLQNAWGELQQRVGATEIGDRLIALFGEGGGARQNVLSRLASVVTGFASTLTDLLLVVFGAIYFAAQPAMYREGLLQLVPHGAKKQIDETLGKIGDALQLWIVGQLLAMLLVGTLTAVGLWLAGVPSAFALGILAGVLEFVPYIGPIAAAIPSLLIASSVDGTTVLWAFAVYVAVQQLEGSVITPLIAHRTVELPPALTLFAIVAFGLLFGVPGLLFAAPLTVATVVAVKMLWVREALGEETTVPGESAPDEDAPRGAGRWAAGGERR